jgi:hypothetical protein
MGDASEEQRQMSPQSGQGMNHGLKQNAETLELERHGITILDNQHRITRKTPPESKTKDGFCLLRHRRAKFTTTAAVEALRALLGILSCASDDPVPMILFR